MTRSDTLSDDDLQAVAADLGVSSIESTASGEASRRAKERVHADIASADASGVTFTPTFFINDRRYDGPWDGASIIEALMRPLGHRLRTWVLRSRDGAPRGAAGVRAVAIAGQLFAGFDIASIT